MIIPVLAVAFPLIFCNFFAAACAVSLIVSVILFLGAVGSYPPSDAIKIRGVAWHFFGWGLGVLAMVGFFGYGMVCSTMPVGNYEATTVTPEEIAIGENTVWLRADGITFSSDTVLTMNAAKENRLAVKRFTRKNSYDDVVEIRHSLTVLPPLEKVEKK